MSGPPGSGKTLLARALPGILPGLSIEEALDITKIYPVADQLPPGEPLIHHRPFRAPHHTVSYAGLVGGGRYPKPGEISLAHRGVLFLDELPEFGNRMLEMLRQPLDPPGKVVAISCSAGSLTYPANFMLVGSMNPCPCGYFSDTDPEESAPAVCRWFLVTRSGSGARRTFGRMVTHSTSRCRGWRSRSWPTTGPGNRGQPPADQRRHGSGRGTPLLPGRRRGAQPVEDGHVAATPQRPGLPPRAKRQAGPDTPGAQAIADLAGEANIVPAHIAEAIQSHREAAHYRPRRQM
jgi:hypothetical protein